MSVRTIRPTFRILNSAIRTRSLKKNFVGPKSGIFLPTYSFLGERNFHISSIRIQQQQNQQQQQKKNRSTGPSLFLRIKNAVTFTASTALVIGALGLAGISLYLLFSELFLPSGDTTTFNHAVTLVEKDPGAQKLLQIDPGTRLKAFGEATGDKWTRNRPLRTSRRIGKDGYERILMRFHVESDNQVGVVSLEAVDKTVFDQEFAYVYLDVPGKKRYYIISPQLPKKTENTGFLGVKWGPKSN
ncbi:hypothetical protein LJB42_002982 [Komagataella kurtzmanii]|nr:hypothetical protein LJB42_002982 [Komagataella kurtzmanii]